MQLLLTHSKKFLIVASLSCFLFIIWLNNAPISILSTDSIWETIGRELNLDHKAETPAVQTEIHKLLADQGKLYSILQAAAPYIYFIHQQTQDRGLPTEMALIPVLESEFNPNDHSKRGATGLWQLMPGTAHDLGIKVKPSYDGRRNVVLSTKAALAYLNDLGNLFKGNWDLALAAYNCGQAKIASAIRRTGSHSFWNLPLPRETKVYVPKLLAIAAIIKNPEKYGVQLPPITNEPYFTELQTNKSVSLARIAKSSGISMETLHTLNPDYTYGSVFNKGGYSLLVPVNKVQTVKNQLADNISSSQR